MAVCGLAGPLVVGAVQLGRVGVAAAAGVAAGAGLPVGEGAGQGEAEGGCTHSECGAAWACWAGVGDTLSSVAAGVPRLAHLV